jgi:hypothetical protein
MKISVPVMQVFQDTYWNGINFFNELSRYIVLRIHASFRSILRVYPQFLKFT